MNQYVYGRRPSVRRLLSKVSHSLTDPTRMWQHLTNVVPSGPVGCMMVIWNEQETIQVAIESSMCFVDRYVVVDRDGATIPLIEELQKKHNFKADYYVEPDLDVWEARRFALKKLTEPWILVQDGDEVFHTSGKFTLLGLKQRMTHPHTYFRSRKNILLDDMKHTRRMQGGYHNFLLHNNGTIRIPGDSTRGFGHDIPRMAGVGIYLKGIYIYNFCINKSRYANSERIPYDENILGRIPDTLRQRYHNPGNTQT